jgi:hypothetical protein
MRFAESRLPVFLEADAACCSRLRQAGREDVPFVISGQLTQFHCNAPFD